MIVIERMQRTEVETWDEAREELKLAGILLPDYAVVNIEAGRPFTVPISLRQGKYVTVRYEPDADR